MKRIIYILAALVIAAFTAGEVTTESGNIGIEWPQWVEGN